MSHVCMRLAKAFLWALCVEVLTAATACQSAESQFYTIFEPALTCDQARTISTRAVERLGYTAQTVSPTSDEKTSLVRATRDGSAGKEAVTVTIACGVDGVHVEAIPDVPPCEQANQRASQAMEHLGFTVTTFSPASTGKRGVIKGTRAGSQGEETTTATILCSPEAVYVDTAADSPLLASEDFLRPISDVRRGFFALFKPMAAAVTQRQQRSNHNRKQENKSR